MMAIQVLDLSRDFFYVLDTLQTCFLILQKLLQLLRINCKKNWAIWLAQEVAVSLSI